MFSFKKSSKDLSNVTVLIKTFQRPKTVNKAIQKIHRFYPDLKILLADDSRTSTPISDKTVQVYKLPFDSGVSEGRNFLLSKAETDLFLMMDDDHFFNRDTRIEKMIDILESNQLDILSCLVFQRSASKRELYRKKLVDFYLNIELEDGTLKFCDGFHEKHDEYLTCDLVHQFFLAKTERIKAMGGWDQKLKTADHADFFIRAKAAGLKVGYTPLVKVDHVHLKEERFSEDYAFFRTRMPEFRKIWIEKHGIERILKRDGSVLSAQDFINQKGW